VVKRKVSNYWATKRLSGHTSDLCIWFKYPKSGYALYGWFEPSSTDSLFYVHAMGGSTRETIMFIYKHKACDNLTWPSVFIGFVYTYCINVNMILINKTTWIKNHFIFYDILLSNLSLTFNKYRGSHKILIDFTHDIYSREQ